MSKTVAPVTTKKWNPTLPPPQDLTLELFTGTPVRLAYGGERQLLDDARHKPITARVWGGFGFTVLASLDNTIHGRLLHLSVAGRDRLPPWEFMIGLKRACFPADVAAAMIAPEEASYVNAHDFCLHWWQLPAQWAVM